MKIDKFEIAADCVDDVVLQKINKTQYDVLKINFFFFLRSHYFINYFFLP